MVRMHPTASAPFPWSIKPSTDSSHICIALDKDNTFLLIIGLSNQAKNTYQVQTNLCFIDNGNEFATFGN